MTGFSIVHIEDEFDEIVFLVNAVKTILEDLIEAEGFSIDSGVKLSIVEAGEGLPLAWIAYSLMLPKFPKLRVHYIFIRSFDVPASALVHLLDSRAFVLDVLRMDPVTNNLENFVDEALASISSVRRNSDKIAFYTAYQGKVISTRSDSAGLRIGKEAEGEVRRFFANCLFDWMNGDEVLT